MTGPPWSHLSHAPWLILTVDLCKVYAISTWRRGNSRSVRYCWKPHHLHLEGWDQNTCPSVLKPVFVLMYNMTLMVRGLSDKEPACQCRRCKRHGFNTWVEKIPWRRKWQPTPIFLLENPIHREAWRAVVHGVAKSWTRLKWLSMHVCMAQL